MGRRTVIEMESEEMSRCILGIEQRCEECRMCKAEERKTTPEMEQEYKELSAAVKESGIPLDLQKKIQSIIFEKYITPKEKMDGES